MRNLILIAMMNGVLLLLQSGGPVWAQTDPDEARLETVHQDIDKETAQKEQNVHVQALATEFKVSPSVVEGLRAQKQGWGEITIALAMAQHLSQTAPKTYPTLAAALRKVETLRSEKMGWGAIAKDLGFKLGPVISAAEHTRTDLVKDFRTERVERVEKLERAERPEHGQRPERPERPQRPERVHR